MKRKLAFTFALLALASILPARADFYWLAVGIRDNAGYNSDGGLGNYLVLTNDDPGVVYNPVKLYDVRRTTDGGTKLRKVSGQSGTAPYEGCPLGGAHYDLRLPIRDAEGNEFTFVGLESEAFKGNDFIGSIKLPDTMEYINYAAFWQAHYLTDFQWPADMTNFTKLEHRIFDTCSRLVGPIEIPSKFVNCGDRMFCDCPALIGAGGVSVTNVGANAFQNCSKLEALELGDGESVTFGTVSMQQAWNQDNSIPKKILFRSAPPVLNAQWLGDTGNSVIDFVANRGVVVYIPLNETKDGPTDSWVQFQTAVAATQSTTSTPNSLTFPTQNGDGTWTDGALKISGSSAKNKTVTVRFWDPDSTATAALMAY